MNEKPEYCYIISGKNKIYIISASKGVERARERPKKNIVLCWSDESRTVGQNTFREENLSKLELLTSSPVCQPGKMLTYTGQNQYRGRLAGNGKAVKQNSQHPEMSKTTNRNTKCGISSGLCDQMSSLCDF